jgi:hypothetical protein
MCQPDQYPPHADRLLERAVDAAIADESRRALADPALMAEDRRQGEMYRERIEGIGYHHGAWMDAARSSMIRREANAMRRRAFRCLPDTAATEAAIAHFGGW